MKIEILEKSVLIDGVEYVKKEEVKKSEDIFLKRVDKQYLGLDFTYYKTDDEFMYPREHLKNLNIHLTNMLCDVLEYFHKETDNWLLFQLANSVRGVSENTNMACLCDESFKRIYEFQKEKFGEFKKMRTDEFNRKEKSTIGKRGK